MLCALFVSACSGNQPSSISTSSQFSTSYNSSSRYIPGKQEVEELKAVTKEFNKLDIDYLTKQELTQKIDKLIEDINAIKTLPNNQYQQAKYISTIFPSYEDNISILKPNVVRYVEAMHKQAEAIENDYKLHDFYVYGDEIKEYSNETDKVRVADYFDQTKNEGISKKVMVVFDAPGFESGTKFMVHLSTDSYFSTQTIATTTSNYVTFKNLYANQDYYYYVSSNEFKSEAIHFVTDAYGRMIDSGAVINFRDMGGRQVEGNKKIKQGLVFRGAQMVREGYTTSSGSYKAKNLDTESLRLFQKELRIKYEEDLRNDGEQSGHVAQLKDEYYNCNYHQTVLYSYTDFFKMGVEQKRGVATFFHALANADKEHVYFHCVAGADRTGMYGFCLGGLLGMSYTDLIIDYEMTSFSQQPRYHHKNIKDNTQFPAFISAIKKLSYFDNNASLSKNIENLLANEFGVSKDDMATIKNIMLEGN